MERLMKIDRRIIYLIAAALVILTLFVPLGLPIKISPMTQTAYDSIENLPDDALVFISPMYDPGARGELDPMFVAMLHQCAKRGYKMLIGNTSWTLGVQMLHPIVTDILGQYGYTYGEDYIELGSKPGGSIWMQQATNDLVTACITDYNNQPLAQFPIISLVPKLAAEYVDAILVLDCGTPGAREWLTYVSTPTGIPLIVGVIQMSIPEHTPYVDSGQYKGLIGGSRGAAEYELLVGKPGKAVKSQDTMSVIALMVTFFILLGNIGYLSSRKK